MSKIYALLIAIDDYPKSDHHLSGCINDLTAVKNHLSDSYGNPLDTLVLTNEQATKQNIINGFDHFAKAVNGDTCLFYFAGHGSKVFSRASSEDYINETLVCWDSRINEGHDLIDIELSYLIWKANENKDIHFLFFTDCGHLGVDTPANKNVRARSINPNDRTLAANNYHGVDNYIKTEVENGFQLSAPIGKYIHLAAAKNKEAAKELPIDGQSRGVFTFSVLDTLKEQGKHLPYQELMNRVRIKVRHRVSHQSPQLKTTTNEIASLPFLNLIPDLSEKPVSISNDQKIKVALIVSPEIAELKSTIQQLEQKLIQLVDLSESPRFYIAADADGFQLQLPNNEKEPIINTTNGHDAFSSLLFIELLNRVIRWIKILEEKKTSSSIQTSEFQLELYRTNEPGNFEDSVNTDSLNWANGNLFSYVKGDDGWEQPGLQLKITNTGNRNLWIAALYLGFDFSITNQLLNKTELKPGAFVWLTDVFEGNTYRTIPLQVEDSFYEAGIVLIKEYLKILIGTKELETAQLNQVGLMEDTFGGDKMDIQASKNTDWISREIELDIYRPWEEELIR